jgi:ribosomal protein S18 acetylase RimI-like enzyme
VTETVVVEQVDELTQELGDALRRLLPQLSASATFDADLLHRVVEHEASTLLVARVAGSVRGALTLVMYPLPTGIRAHIDDVVVDEEARGQGVGAALVRAALDLAESRGARTIDLTSRPSRAAAIRLYERLGFVRRDSNLYRYLPPSSS